MFLEDEPKTNEKEKNQKQIEKKTKIKQKMSSTKPKSFVLNDATLKKTTCM